MNAVSDKKYQLDYGLDKHNDYHALTMFCRKVFTNNHWDYDDHDSSYFYYNQQCRHLAHKEGAD